MSIIENGALKNSLDRMFSINNDMARQMVIRLASEEQLHSKYTRNGTLNFGARQLINVDARDVYVFGVGGGDPVVGV